MQSTDLIIDERKYKLYLKRSVPLSGSVPRLVIVAYQPNQLASQILQVCIRSIQHFTPEAHELWVVDNASPKQHNQWLGDLSNINVVWNDTMPLPKGRRRVWQRIGRNQTGWGSYANAVALEIAAKLVPADTQSFMTLHMDTLVCKTGWLSFLEGKINQSTRAAGVRLDFVRSPEGVLHVLGLLFDFQLFRRLNLQFLPELPKLDVGDRVTMEFRKAGYQLFACKNTLWQPELVETIPPGSPFRDLPVDRSFDDQGDIIFLHLGRGVRKTTSRHVEKITAARWIQFAQNILSS